MQQLPADDVTACLYPVPMPGSCGLVLSPLGGWPGAELWANSGGKLHRVRTSLSHHAR